jgi:prophage antirepressor-like protein
VKDTSSLNIYGTFEKPWFLASHIGIFLGLVNIRATIANMDKDYIEMRQIQTSIGLRKAIFLNECGLYYIMMRSDKPEAKPFQKWIVQEVLPSIRKQGKYVPNDIVRANLTFNIQNELDLHVQVINFIKVQFQHALLTIANGELQNDTYNKRVQSKLTGYECGTFDIIINNLHKKFTGFAIELKSPTGKGIISENQLKMQLKYKQNGFKTLISNDYNYIICEIIEYMSNIRLKCQHCEMKFKSIKTLTNHHKFFHRIE